MRTLFSFSREFRLKNSAGDQWAVVHRPTFSNDLVFSDCIGDRLVRFVGDGSWFSTPSFTVLDTDGKVLGKAGISKELSTKHQTFVFVKSAEGRAVAQLIQDWSWNSAHTAVHALVDPNRLGDSDNPRVSPVDPLVDMRILALYSAIGFGGDAFFIWGLVFDFLGAFIPLVAVGLAIRKYSNSGRESFKQVPGDDESADMLLQRREEVMRSVQEIEDELAKQARQQRALWWSTFTMRCCSARSSSNGTRPQRSSMWNPCFGHTEAQLERSDSEF